MTPDATPRIVSRHIHERQTAPSTAPVPKARPWRRGQAPKPHSGAPKAQGLTAAIAVAAPSLGPSIEPDNPVSLNATGANAPMNAFATSRIYTSLTDATKVGAREYVISLGVATMSSGTRLTKLAGSICSKPCVSYADVTDCVCKNDYISSRGMADILQRERRAWAPSLLMWAMRLLRSAHFRRPPMQRR